MQVDELPTYSKMETNEVVMVENFHLNSPAARRKFSGISTAFPAKPTIRSTPTTTKRRASGLDKLAASSLSPTKLALRATRMTAYFNKIDVSTLSTDRCPHHPSCVYQSVCLPQLQP